MFKLLDWARTRKDETQGWPFEEQMLGFGVSVIKGDVDCTGIRTDDLAVDPKPGEGAAHLMVEHPDLERPCLHAALTDAVTLRNLSFKGELRADGLLVDQPDGGAPVQLWELQSGPEPPWTTFEGTVTVRLDAAGEVMMEEGGRVWAFHDEEDEDEDDDD